MESLVFLILIWIVSGVFGSKDKKKNQAPPPKPIYREGESEPVNLPRRVNRPPARPIREVVEERPEPLSYEELRERQQALKRRLQQKHASKTVDREGSGVQGSTMIERELERKKAQTEKTRQPQSVLPQRPEPKAWPKDHAPHEGYCEIDQDLYVEGAAASLPDVEAPAVLEPRSFNPNALVAAVVMKEVLDKPLALRQNRR